MTGKHPTADLILSPLPRMNMGKGVGQHRYAGETGGLDSDAVGPRYIPDACSSR